MLITICSKANCLRRGLCRFVELSEEKFSGIFAPLRFVLIPQFIYDKDKNKSSSVSRQKRANNSSPGREL